MAHPARVVRAPAMPAGTPEVPVAIVGAGACGLTTALMLRDAGTECVLLERRFDGGPEIGRKKLPGREVDRNRH